MRKLLVFISMIFFLSSCEQQIKHYYIPQEMKPLFVKNDTICFSDSANNRIDSFLVDITHSYQVFDSKEYFEELDVYYKVLNKHASFKGLHFLLGGNGSIISISGHYFPRSVIKDGNNVDIIKNNVSIHGIIYPSAYVLQAYDFPDSIPGIVYFTFQHGIVRYDYSDGRHYELIKK